MKHLAVLGSTGSIGASTLSLCESFPDRFRPVTLAAGHNLEAAFTQALHAAFKRRICGPNPGSLAVTAGRFALDPVYKL